MGDDLFAEQPPSRWRRLRAWLHRAVPLRHAHPLSVNARVVAWAAVEAVVTAPVLAVLLCLYCVSLAGEVVTAVFEAVVSWVEWAHRHAGGRIERRKRRVHNAEFNRRVCAWVGRLCPVAEPVQGIGPSLADLRGGYAIGNGISVRWSGGRSVVLMPGHHAAPLFDDEAFGEARRDAAASRVKRLEKDPA